MDGFIIFYVAFAALAMFAALAVGFGVDSRIDSTDPRRSPNPVGIEA